MKTFKKTMAIFLLAVMAVGLTACISSGPDTTAVPHSPTTGSAAPAIPTEPTAAGSTGASGTIAPTIPTIPGSTAAPTVAPTIAPTPAPDQPAKPNNQKLIVIDAGHQAKGNNGKEPMGPGSDVLKTKVAAGATGVATGLKEYELTLMVSLKLQAELEKRGYEVIMIRTTHDVDISNAERAQIANAYNADAFIRIHGNSYDDPSVHGALTMCQTRKNPFNGSLYQQCRSLSEDVLDGIVAATGCKKRTILESDTMSGINWCQIPVTIVEMGFMSNPEEDRLMATDDYQTKIAVGIANGLDAYFGIN